MFKKRNFFLAAIGVVSLVVYFWLVSPINTGLEISHRFDWPDEVSNYFWITNYAETSQLYVAEPLNLIAENQIHPRSFNVREDGSLVPGSFFGLILVYGLIAKLFSSTLAIYFTPILAIIASFCFYGIIRHIFDLRIALLSLVLMLFHPAWLYYSVTPMLPNACFVSLIIISVWLLIFRKNRISSIQVLFSALALGFAVSVRPVEIFWIFALYFLIFIYLFKRLDWQKIILFLVILFLAVIPSIYQQQILFGSIFTSGYDQFHIEKSILEQSAGFIKSFIAPFGIHPRLATENLWLYFFKQLWWLSFLAVLGLFVSLFNFRKRNELFFGYVIFSLFLFFWLGNFYGSWQFEDKLTVKLNVLGISYLRYWLPIYLVSVPFIASGLAWISSLLKTRVLKKSALAIFIIFLLYNSLLLSLFKNEDSILPVRRRIAEYKKTAARVISLTEQDSIIITVRKDKVFFPERKVIHTFEKLSDNQKIQNFLPNLINEAPVYYYSLEFEKNLEMENGMSLELVQNIGNEVLYKIK